MDYKQSLQTFVIFLSAAINFGNSFCGNSQSPLQQEIERYLHIDDSQFNLFFSVRALSSMIIPFVMPYTIEKIGIRNTTIIMSLCCVLGQYCFIIGLERKSYHFCLISRVIFGISDSMTIVQQILMCTWFTAEQLPIAFSLMLFMVKLVRAVNDNTASLIYNASKSLEQFFWIGLYVSIFSLICSFALC